MEKLGVTGPPCLINLGDLVTAKVALRRAPPGAEARRRGGGAALGAREEPWPLAGGAGGSGGCAPEVPAQNAV